MNALKSLKSPKGTRDRFGKSAALLHWANSLFYATARKFGFLPCATPHFESKDLFVRGLGTDTEVVGKELWTLGASGKDIDATDKSSSKQDDFVLRPEATASVIRAIIEGKLHNLDGSITDYTTGSLLKYAYTGAMFRHERPQAGRLREFNQFGAELLGSKSPHAEVEVINLATDYLLSLGLKVGVDYTLLLNTIGCPQCREQYKVALVKYLGAHKDKLCHNCQVKLETNPLRILDCKRPGCKTVVTDAPKLSNYLSSDCKAHFDAVKTGLDERNILYKIESNLVRGLDYYTGTVFEFDVSEQSAELKGQTAIGGGGRYDNLVAELGGTDTPAVGFALGYERIEILLKELGKTPDLLVTSDVFVAAEGDNVVSPPQSTLDIVQQLRKAGLAVEYAFESVDLKSQLKLANRLHSRFTLIITDEYTKSGKVELKNMADGSQELVELSEVSSKVVGH